MSSSRDTLVEEIRALARERNAIILAHNYQRPEVQDVADVRGDSLDLARKAAATDAEVIVFCGVHFMAETAAMLSPDKVVLLPEPSSGCPMADMVEVEPLRELKAEHPDALVVCYVNTSAAVKAESDVCCTSANAVALVNDLPADREVIFVPDRYLGGFVQRKTGRELILWNGFCPSHARIKAENIATLKEAHPDAVVLAHPETPPEATALADHLLGTNDMLRFVAKSDAQTFIIATEPGMLHRLRHESPDKTFLAATDNAICPNMKRNTLESIKRCLETLEPRITVPAEIRKGAMKALNAMLSRG